MILGNTSPILNRPPQPNGETLNLAAQLIQIAFGAGGTATTTGTG